MCRVYRIALLGMLLPCVAWAQTAARPMMTIPEPAAVTAAALPSHPLQIPQGLPGADTPPLQLPPLDPRKPDANRDAAIQRLLPDLPPEPGLIQPQPGPQGTPLELPALEQMALCNHPLIHQAHAAVQSAQGAAIQAGAWPNPQVGFQGDTIGTGATGGYQGGSVSQTIVTGGKRRLAANAAMVDVENARLAMRHTQIDVATAVRTAYFALLVAETKYHMNAALLEFADNVYRVQVARVRAGQAAPYEPLQLRVLAVQARSQLRQSQNDYRAAWRQLAAALGCPEMPLTAVTGNLNAPIPQLTYDAAWCWIQQNHTDLMTAQNLVLRAEYLLHLAEITPRCPDVNVNSVVEKDFTTPPYGTTVSLQVNTTIPLFDQNRGNILAAQAELTRSRWEYSRASTALVATLSDAWNRYETNREILVSYRDMILPDQVRAYRALYDRYQHDSDGVDFSDLVTAQQTLNAAVASYSQSIGDTWQAVIDLAAVMQLDALDEIHQLAPASAPPAGPPTAPTPVEPLPVPPPAGK